MLQEYYGDQVLPNSSLQDILMEHPGIHFVSFDSESENDEKSNEEE